MEFIFVSRQLLTRLHSLALMHSLAPVPDLGGGSSVWVREMVCRGGYVVHEPRPF